jgi:hypothetical protein
MTMTRKLQLMQRKMFWVIFLVLSTVAGIVLPLLWSVLATIPLVFLSWWIAYRSGWF